MTTRSISPVGRAATALVLAGAGLSFSGATAWAGTTVPCGTPAHPALYTTTHHDAAPAVTHEVTVIDQAHVPGEAGVTEESHIESTWVDGDGVPEGDGWSATGEPAVVVDAPAYTEHGWLRTVIDVAGVEGHPAVPAVTHDQTVVDTAAWDETVIDSAAKPAVDEVSHFITVVDKAAWDETVVDANGYAFTQKNGNVRFESSANWNAGDGGAGWTRAANLDQTHVVHHDAVTHQEKVIDTPASPAVPAVTHVEHHDAVTHQEKVIDTPASPAVPAVTHLEHHDAVTHQETVIDVPGIPAVEAVEELSHPETAWTHDAAIAPEGDGWVLSGEERVHDAQTHVRYEFTRTVVDVAGAPAVEEVPGVSHTETVVDVPEAAPWDEQVLVNEATPAGAPCPPKVETAVLGETATADPASVPAQTQSLAHTGSDLVVPLGAGLVLVVVGGALAAAGRRREV